MPGPAATGDEFRIRALGTAGFEFDDGKTVVLADPFVTRPGVWRLARGPLDSDDALARAWCPRADFILVSHAHYDHVMDVPAIALRTGAAVVGSRSALNLARSRGVPAERLVLAEPGGMLTLGSFRVQVASSAHARIMGIDNPMAGTISPKAGRLWFWQYRHDASLSYRLESGGASVWLHQASPFTPGESGGRRAGTLIVGLAGLAWTRERAEAIMAETGPDRVIPTHFDDFFRPLSKGPALLPGLDYQAARKAFAQAAPATPWIALQPGETLSLGPDQRGTSLRR